MSCFLHGVNRKTALATAAFLPLTFVVHAQNVQAGASMSLANKTMVARLGVEAGKSTLEVDDVETHRTFKLPESFTIALKGGSILQSSSLQWNYSFTPAATDTGSATPGACAEFEDRRAQAHFQWCLLMKPDTSYLRETLTIRAIGQDLAMTDVRLLDLRDAGAHVSGSVKGSPIVDGRMFFGFEHPLSWSRVVNGEAEAGITRVLPLQKGQSVTYSAVIGTAGAGQMRRAFLNYIEAERPRPYKPFLHYNSWYDIGYTNRYSEADAIDRINTFGRELVYKRGVQLDSFLFDDGWDNPNSFWSFNSGFPEGLTNVSAAAAKIHAGVGVWVSPWGGYEQEKVERIRYGRAHGYEIIRDGYALSGPKYYRDFSKVCLEMVDRYNVNQFKIDGTGNADRVFPGSAFDSDFDAAIHLIGQIRKEKPDVFINLTTGTYASPFWLFYADSIFRAGEDHDFGGVGTQRQRWITYRDEQTYRNIVLRGPLFPLNSLMLHGIIYAKQAKDLDTDPKGDFADEVQSYFGSGTQLQEMYITPSLLSPANWDTLANAAKWSRAHSDILKDTHWIGGDPGKLQVYGWAAWAPSGWIITLRNPSNVEQSYALNLKTALELPQGAPSSFAVEQPFSGAAQASLRWNAGRTISIHLKPFEVRTFESASETGR